MLLAFYLDFPFTPGSGAALSHIFQRKLGCFPNNAYLCRRNKTNKNMEKNFNDGQPPYTVEELNARIDEAELEMDRGEGKTFSEMMNGFRKELLWLKWC